MQIILQDGHHLVWNSWKNGKLLWLRIMEVQIMEDALYYNCWMLLLLQMYLFNVLPLWIVYYIVSSVNPSGLEVVLRCSDKWIVQITEITLNTSINITITLCTSSIKALAWILLVWRKQETYRWLKYISHYKMASPPSSSLVPRPNFSHKATVFPSVTLT